MNKDYLEGLQAGLDLATKMALDNGIELTFPKVSELKFVKEETNDSGCARPTPKDGKLYSCGGKSGVFCKECVKEEKSE